HVVAIAPPTSPLFFLYCYHQPRDLHSFPTRRSSDLKLSNSKKGLPLAEDRADFTPCQTTRIVAKARNRFCPMASKKPRFWVSRLDRKSTTSELQSRGHLVCRLLLEKKKKKKNTEQKI